MMRSYLWQHHEWIWQSLRQQSCNSKTAHTLWNLVFELHYFTKILLFFDKSGKSTKNPHRQHLYHKERVENWNPFTLL